MEQRPPKSHGGVQHGQGRILPQDRPAVLGAMCSPLSHLMLPAWCVPLGRLPRLVSEHRLCCGTHLALSSSSVSDPGSLRQLTWSLNLGLVFVKLGSYTALRCSTKESISAHGELNSGPGAHSKFSVNVSQAVS